ncbi:MAG TPA: Gfo/Idh/MocA family oxidoreductase [Candidatus Binatia bacterium]|jgi:myo-inositol 2-dehydrogenase/D-chiro-inositol 1-dehydrogenase|nr:Gfo/Idh/MocA family oxidoreductase [Candidatus Binatia bacterium]
MNTPSKHRTSRRSFLKTSALVGGALAAPSGLLRGAEPASDSRPPAAAATSTTGTAPIVNSKTLRVGLIGCGGRGSGAADQALAADKHVVLVAMGDAFEDRLQTSLKNLQTKHAQQVKVTPEQCFVGLDAYQKVIDSGIDVVLLATPPGFRPAHLKAAVDACKHIFCEKPMATDAPGLRSVLDTVQRAKEKNLSLVAGFCYRYNHGVQAIMQKIHDGAIGEPRALYTVYNTGSVWSPFPRQPEWTDMQYQVKNWYYYTWLSGDHIVEQAVHSLDKMAWVMKDEPPMKCVALGGRQVRTAPEFGNIFDHFSVVYDYANGVKGFHSCRQQPGCFSDNSDYFMGSEGVAHIVRAFSGPFVIKARTNWRFHEEKPTDMYQNEHDALFASIRTAKPINDGVRMAHSTLLAIMGRMAAYTGQEITWDQALNSQENLAPSECNWSTPIPVPPVAMPGQTKFT